MMNLPIRPETLSSRRLHFLQQLQIRSAFGLCLGFTLLVGLTLAVMFRNPWWLVWSGFATLLFGGVVVAARVGTGHFLSGVLIALLYFSTVGLIYLVGQVAEVWLPPWPSLPHHASTYFFLWPPALVLAGVLRLIVVGFNRRFGREAGLIFLRLIPIMTALSVILVATFRPMPPSVAQPEWQQPPLAEGDVILNEFMVTPLINDGSGGLWVGTYGGGVSYYDPARDTWQAFTVASTSGGLGSNDVRTLLIDEAGELWVGTFGGGISRYSPRLNTWELYTVETTGGGLVSDYVLTLLPGENGELWAGLSNLRNQGGLAYFDGERWRSYTVTSTDGGLLSNDVRTLALDGTEGLWIGTRGGGLSHLAADQQTWTTFTVKSTGGGLTGNTVLALLPDSAGGVWVGTGSGLSHLRRSKP